MAIYHFSAKVISRAVGSSAVAAAAYRSADRLHDKRLGRSHDFVAEPLRAQSYLKFDIFVIYEGVRLKLSLLNHLARAP